MFPPLVVSTVSPKALQIDELAKLRRRAVRLALAHELAGARTRMVAQKFLDEFIATDDERTAP
jgi:hypothetical protein